MIVIKVTELDKQDFNVKVTEVNYYIIRDLLNKERDKIVKRLKTYRNAGLIGSIAYPRNNLMQKELDDLVSKKRLIKNSIEKINKIFTR